MRRHSTPPGENDKPLSKADYGRWVEEWADAGNWFMFRRQLLGIMSPAAAVITQSLLNLASKKSKDGWVRCTAAFVGRQLYLPRRVQDRAFNELKDAGYVELEVRGMPPHRWARLDRHRMEADMAALPDPEGDAQLHQNVQIGNSTGETVQLHQNVQIDCTKTYNNKHKTSSTKKSEMAERAPPASAGSGDDTDYMGEAPTARHGRPDALDAARISKLRGFAAGHGWTVSRSPKRWGGALQTLKRKLGGDAGRIDAALDFLTSHDVTEPRVYDFAQLGAVWNWVTDLMEKDSALNPAVEVSPEAEQLVKLIRRGTPLPAGALAQLPAAVQLSLDNLRAFRRKVAKAYPGWKTGGAGFARAAITKFGDSYVERWFEDISQWASGKDKLRLIPRRVVSVDHEDFRNAGESLAREYGDVNLWRNLMKEVGNA